MMRDNPSLLEEDTGKSPAAAKYKVNMWGHDPKRNDPEQGCL